MVEIQLLKKNNILLLHGKLEKTDALVKMILKIFKYNGKIL
jgi:hypothetical protein